MREVVKEENREAEEKMYMKDEEEKVKRKLKSLGYL